MRLLQTRSVKIWIAISLLSLIFYSCHRDKKLVVQPISQEFNHEYLTGDGLDTINFNTNDVMQYFEVSNYDGLSDNQIMTDLDSFAIASYPSTRFDNIQKLTLLFYKKKMFTDYGDNLYESARDNDTRRLVGYGDDLLASLTFERTKQDSNRMSFRRLLYNKNKLKVKIADTILIR